MRFLFLSLLLFLELLATNEAVVFVYHRFGEGRYPSTNIKLEQFAKQLDYLHENNYTLLPLSKVIHHLQNKIALPPKTVSLTMDDAYYSVYTNAYPMLKEKGYPFSVFVNTKAIDKGSKNYITWDQMREMQQDLGVEFLNHSLSHDYLIKKEQESLEDFNKRVSKEILQAQKRLDEELGTANLKILAYTFGEYDTNTKALVEKLGYVGVAQNSSPIGERSDMLALTRFPMAESFAHMQGFTTKLNTRVFPIKSVTPTNPIMNEENPPRLEIELERPLRGVSCFLSSGEPIEIKWRDATHFEIQATHRLKEPRDLYTCTAPAKDKKWYWYSHLWIVAKR